MEIIYLIYGLVFFVLGVVTLMLPKQDPAFNFFRHLGLFAVFGMLHGMVEFIELLRINHPIMWLKWVAKLLLLSSYLSLLEFARRCWNDMSDSIRLHAVWVYGAITIGVVTLMQWTIDPLIGLEAGTCFFVGVPATVLTSSALFTAQLSPLKANSHNLAWLRLIPVAFICYGLSTLFLSQSDLNLSTSLPTQADFLNTFGFPIQLLSTTFAMIVTLGFIIWVRQSNKNNLIDAMVLVSHEGIVITDANAVIVRINEAFTKITGYTHNEVVGEKISMLKSGRHDEAFYAAMWGSIQRTGSWEGEIWDRCKNGEISAKWLSISTVKSFDVAVNYYVGTFADVSQHRLLHQIKAIIDTSFDGFLIVNATGKVLQTNETYSNTIGYSVGDLLQMNINQLRVKEKSEKTSSYIAQIVLHGYDRFETRHRHKDGHVIDIEVSAAYLPEFQQFCLFCRDITERKLIELDQRIAAIAFESQQGMVVTDKDTVILRINKAFTKITGYTHNEAVGKKISMLKSGRHDEAFYAEMWDSIQRTGLWEGEIWDRRKNGDIYPKWSSITAVKGHDDIISHYVGAQMDISDRKSAEEKIKLLAFYDPLTQLPNRRLLLEQLKHDIKVEHRDGKKFALLMLDLDRFKAVNDSLGHLAGDELLQQVAARIKAILREVDMVARLGGDEFIVLLDGIAYPEGAARVAKEIITALTIPFYLLQNDKAMISASIGISLYPQHGDSPEELMEHADAAMYQAKEAGRGCFAYFSEEMTIAARKRVVLEARLRNAIANQELRVFYQPQVDIASDRIIGAEALVRWLDPIEGLIPPIRFIPIAEETGLIIEIGAWVLRETCRQGREWLDAGLPPLTLAVNVSPVQFRRCDLNALVTTVLVETGFPAGQLEFEITESGLMENQSNATTILNGLRAQGIRLAIDDFGTGYSSLAHLKNFPLDILKIDKCFIDDIPFHQDDMEIASSIIAMGHILGFKVLAEGVETPEQLAFLQEKDCDMYQGHIKSKPLPAEEFTELLREQQA